MKNTIMNLVDRTMELVAPHKCYGCGQPETVLCDRCTTYILQQTCPICGVCRKRLRSGNLCKDCRKAASNHLTDLQAVGWRVGILRKLTNEYKFQSRYRLGQTLARLMCRVIPADLKGRQDVGVCYIPTIRRHIRQRGFDHMERVAEVLGRQLGCPVVCPLVRLDNHVQHGANQRARKLIKYSLGIVPNKLPAKIILLDDIWTTGATMQTAAQLLRSMGVRRVYGVVVCIQPRETEKVHLSGLK